MHSFTLLLFITIFLLYNWILLQLLLSKKQLFLYKITSKWRLLSFLLLFFIAFCYILLRIKLRFYRLGFLYNIYEVYYVVKDYMYMAYNACILQENTVYLLFFTLFLLILLLGIVLFWILFIANIIKILRLSLIAVYVYLLQFLTFKKLNKKVFNFILGTRTFIILNFEFCPAELLYYINDIWRTFPINLEFCIYRGLPIYLLFLDIIANHGTLIIFTNIMPWYSIYSITRNFMLFMKKLILDVEFKEISLDMYGNKLKNVIRYFVKKFI